MLGDFPLKDKIAVITGAGSGINLAFTQLAAFHGAKCIIADLRLTAEAEAYLKTAKNAIFTKCDVTQWSDLQNLVTVSRDEFGDVPDIYVPGAGVFEPKWSNFWDDTETSRYAEIDINISHPIKLARIAIRALLGANKKGVVLMVASVAGLAGNYAAPLYCATKHAIVGFVKSMAAAEMLEGVKVVAICPAIVKTPLWTTRPDMMQQYSVRDDASVSVDDVTQAMLDLIQDGKYGGGTVFKCDIDVKEVVQFNERILPGGERGEEERAEVMDKIHRPIVEMLRGERGTGTGTGTGS